MSVALRHVHVSVDKALNFQGWGWISARLVSPTRGSFSTASSIFVRATYGGFFLLSWSWMGLRIHQNRSAHSPENFKACVCSCVALVPRVGRQEGCVSCRSALGWGKKLLFLLFFKVPYNEMDSCCIWSQKLFLTWYSGTSFSSLGQP